jgi:hypothetical protein
MGPRAWWARYSFQNMSLPGPVRALRRVPSERRFPLRLDAAGADAEEAEALVTQGLRSVMANGMRRDFSWDVQGREYEVLYGWLAG